MLVTPPDAVSTGLVYGSRSVLPQIRQRDGMDNVMSVMFFAPGGRPPDFDFALVIVLASESKTTSDAPTRRLGFKPWNRKSTAGDGCAQHATDSTVQ